MTCSNLSFWMRSLLRLNHSSCRTILNWRNRMISSCSLIRFSMNQTISSYSLSRFLMSRMISNWNRPLSCHKRKIFYCLCGNNYKKTRETRYEL